MSDTMRESIRQAIDLVHPIAAVSEHTETVQRAVDACEILRMALSQPAPPVPSSVQEIMRLMTPYVSACLKFNNAPGERIISAEAEVNAAFSPLCAALTALVDECDRLKFELDGIRGTAAANEPAHWAKLRALGWSIQNCKVCGESAMVSPSLDGVNAMRRPLKQADSDMADEYQRWIDFYHAGNGDYVEFLRGIEPEQGEVKSS